MIGADAIVKCLEKEGVEVLFGYPGVAICPFFNSVLSTDIEAILVRTEQNAAHAASGYARVTGKVGVHFGFAKQLSLKNALSMSGIDFTGREHDALDDARNTAELLQIFMDKELFEKTLKKIEEVMTPKTIGNTLGDLFNFSALVTA